MVVLSPLGDDYKITIKDKYNLFDISYIVTLEWEYIKISLVMYSNYKTLSTILTYGSR